MNELIEVLTLQLIQHSISMKQAETYTELEEQNGTMTTQCHLYGNFINQVKFLMDPIGIIGELSRRFNGEITIQIMDDFC